MPDIPFVIERNHITSLSNQIVHGFTAAIRAGHYPPGARLPCIRDIAKELGASEMVVRGAIKQLSQNGEIVARPRSGIRVVESGKRSWGWHVLYLYWSDSFYFTARNRFLSQMFDEANIRETSILMAERELQQGMPTVKATLDTAAIDLVLLSGAMPGLISELSRRGAPFVSALIDEPSDLAAGALRIDSRAAYAEMAAYCHSAGIQTITAVHPQAGSRRDGLEDAFVSAGVGYREAYSETFVGGTPENVERAGYETVTALLQQEPKPEALYFVDDYCARGGLTAILEQGLRIPDDLQVLSLTIEGHCPVMAKSLTRIEVSPRVHAQGFFNLVADYFAAKGKPLQPRTVSPTFVVGETTRV